MVRVAVLGATGYTAFETIRLLLRNPQVQITAATTRQEGSPSIASIHPSLTGRLDLKCEDLSPKQIAERADFALQIEPTRQRRMNAGNRRIAFLASGRGSDLHLRIAE